MLFYLAFVVIDFRNHFTLEISVSSVFPLLSLIFTFSIQTSLMIKSEFVFVFQQLAPCPHPHTEFSI